MDSHAKNMKNTTRTTTTRRNTKTAALSARKRKQFAGAEMPALPAYHLGEEEQKCMAALEAAEVAARQVTSQCTLEDLACLKKRIDTFKILEQLEGFDVAQEHQESPNKALLSVLPRFVPAQTTRKARCFTIPTRNRFAPLVVGTPKVHRLEPLWTYENLAPMPANTLLVSQRPKYFQYFLDSVPFTRRMFKEYKKLSRPHPNPLAVLQHEEAPWDMPTTTGKWNIGPDGHVWLNTKSLNTWKKADYHDIKAGLTKLEHYIFDTLRSRCEEAFHGGCPVWSCFGGTWFYENYNATNFPTTIDYDELLNQYDDEDELLEVLSSNQRARQAEMNSLGKWRLFNGEWTKEAHAEHELNDRSHSDAPWLWSVCGRRDCWRKLHCKNCGYCCNHCDCFLEYNGTKRVLTKRPAGPSRSRVHRSLRAFHRRILRKALQEKKRRTQINAQLGDFQLPKDFKIPSDFTLSTTNVLHIPGMEQLVAWLTAENKGVDWLTFIKELGFLCMHIANGGFTLTNVTTSILHFLSNVKCAAVANLKLPEWVTSLAEKAFGMFNAQAGELLSIIPVIGSILVSVVAAIVMGRLPGGKDTDVLLSRAAQIGRLITSHEKIAQCVQPWLEMATDFMRKHCYGYSEKDLSGWKLIDEWCNEVMTLRTPTLEADLKVDKTLGQKITTLIQRGQVIQRELDGLRIPATSRAHVTDCIMFLNQARTLAAGSAAGLVAPRIAPITVHFFGDSGVGKSTMLGYLNADLLIASGCRDPSDLHDKVYYRRPYDEDWDGFRNGTIGVVCDDAFSVKDSASSPNQGVSEQIHMGNTAHFPLSMAHLSDKGTTVFDAHYVIWTTNRAHFAFESLTNPEAVYNRVSLKYRMRVAPEFAVAKKVNGTMQYCLDWKKLAEAMKTDPQADRKAMLFDRVHPTSNIIEIQQAGLTYTQMRDECIAELKCKRQVGADMLQRFNDYFQQQANAQGVVDTLSAAYQWFRFHFTPSRVYLGGGDVAGNGLVANFTNAPCYIKIGSPAFYETPGFLKRLKDAATFNLLADDMSFAHLNLWQSMLNYVGTDDPEPALFHSPCQYSLDQLMNAHCLIVQEEYADHLCRQMAAYLRYCSTTTDAALRNEAAKLFLTTPFNICALDKEHNHTAFCRPHCPDIHLQHFTEGLQQQFRLHFRKEVIETPIMTKMARKINSNFETIARFVLVMGGFWLYTVFLGWLGKKTQTKAAEWGSELAYKRAKAKGYNLTPEQETFLAERERNRTTAEAAYIRACRTEAYNQHGVKAAKRNVEGLRTIDFDTEVTTEAYNQNGRAAARRNVEAYNSNGRAIRRHNIEGFFNRLRSNAEGCSDQNAQEVVDAVFKNAYMFLSRDSDDDQWLIHGTATALTGRVFLTNNHIWAGARKNIALTTANGHIMYEFPKNECVNSAYREDTDAFSNDVCLFEAPRHVQLHRSILQHIHNSDDMSAHQTFKRIGLIGYNCKGIPKIQYSDRVVAKDRLDKFELRAHTGTSYIRGTYQYGIETSPGDCGAIAVAFDTAINHKIIGMHMAAGLPNSEFTGVATPLRYGQLLADLNDLREHFKHPESWVPSNISVDQEQLAVVSQAGEIQIESPMPAGFTYIGKTDTPPHAATETKIRPSPAHGLVQEPTTKPAMLKPGMCADGVWRNPRDVAMAKACVPPHFVNTKHLRIASNAVRQLLDMDVRVEDKQLLTFEECFMGKQGNDLYTPMNRQASPGYGWKKGLGVGKNPWLTTSDGEWRFDHPEVLEKFAAKEALLSCGERPQFMWIDTLKDERRPPSKTDVGKTRLFSAGEMIGTALLRKYFMGFCAHVMRHPVEFEACVGLNVYGMHWDQLARALQTHGDHVVAGDFTNYDGSLSAQILWEVCDIINDYYGDEYAEERRLLWLEIVNSIHVSGENVYMWNHSQPSGCAFTTILNSVYHSIAVRMVYLACAEKYCPDEASMQSFLKHVVHVNYGDDDVTNIHPSILEWFNQHTMTEMYHTLGMVYTDETKCGNPPRSRSLAEVKFLKRSFAYDKNQTRWRAPLCDETILEMTNWVHGSDGMFLLHLELEQAVYEAAQHPRQKYEWFLQRMAPVQRLVRSSYPVYFPTYEEAQHLDAMRYCGIAVADLHPKLRDRGIGALADSPFAANPAGVTRPREMFQLTTAESVGELLSSSDECVPTLTHRLLVQPTGSETEFTLNAQSGLADNNTNTITRMSAAPGASSGTANSAGPSFAGMGETHTQETTTFIEDGDVSTQDFSSMSAPRGFTTPATDSLANEITNVLERPIQIATFDWATTGAPFTELVRLNLPLAFLQVPMYAQKLNGFRYVRFDVNFEVQVNAQPFNAGMLMAYFEPLQRQLRFNPSSVATLQGLSGYPKIYYRCGSESALRFTVPFQPVLSHFDTVRQFGTMGDFVVKVVAPLTGAADVDGTVWMWASNISFEMPTGLPTLISSASNIPHEDVNAQAGEEPWVAAGDAPPAASTAVKAEEKKTPGKIGTILGGLSAISTGVSAASLALFPPLAPFASAGSAILGAGAAIARIFGWSKPVDHSTVQLIQQSALRHMANSNGDSKVKSFALDAENATNMALDVFGDSNDTMAIANLVRRRTIIDIFDWTAAKVNGDLLWMWPVVPSACLKSAGGTMTLDGVAGKVTVAANSYLSYLANTARFWRGSIKYRFLLVKTAFHSGRMTVYWIPGAVMNTNLASVDRNMLYKRVYDLRTTTEFEIEIPYTHNAHWMPLHTPTEDSNRDRITVDVPTGLILVEVTNALRAPSTAADHFLTVVEVSAGDDFQFAYPEMRKNVRVLQASNGISPPGFTFNAQSGEQIYQSPTDLSLAPNSATIGETYLSLRQLLKRYVAPPTFDDSAQYPFLDMVRFDAIPAIPNSMEQANNIWTWAASLFRYKCGSVKVLDVVTGPTGGRVDYTITPSPGVLDLPIDATVAPKINTSTTVEPLCEYHIPFYQLWPAIPTGTGEPLPAFLNGGTYTRVPWNEGTRIARDLSDSETMSVLSYRAISEDFSYGFPLGPPATGMFTANP